MPASATHAGILLASTTSMGSTFFFFANRSTNRSTTHFAIFLRESIFHRHTADPFFEPFGTQPIFLPSIVTHRVNDLSALLFVNQRSSQPHRFFHDDSQSCRLLLIDHPSISWLSVTRHHCHLQIDMLSIRRHCHSVDDF